LNESSYDRVNIMKAKQVVILTPTVVSPPSDSAKSGNFDDADEEINADEENLKDSKTIFTYNIIKKKNPQVNVVTELIAQENIAYMLDNPLYYFLVRKFDYP
jgi:hypothetical protein